MRTLAEIWNHFWFGPENPRALAALRIAWGIALFQKVTGCYGLYRLPRMRFLFPRHEYFSEQSYPVNPEGFSPSYPGLGWLHQPSFEVYHTIENLLLVLSILFLLGLAFRVVGPLTALLVGYTFASSPFFYHHHIFQMAIVTSILGFSRSADRWSLDALIPGLKRERVGLTRMPRRMIQVLVSIIYFFTSVSKLNHGWLSGKIFDVFKESGSFYGHISPWILDHFSYQALGLITVGTEIFLVFGLWIPRVRILAILAGVGLHLGIDSMMGVGSFSYQMIALYVAFLFGFPDSKEAIHGE
ncbi:MAG: HTTM domain-containing protein [Candidatus Omnitrophica bacterium]|nr:HTTM domain-containing protein [Candidatus Omnitrophota bacterium]